MFHGWHFLISTGLSEVQFRKRRLARRCWHLAIPFSAMAVCGRWVIFIKSVLFLMILKILDQHFLEQNHQSSFPNSKNNTNFGPTSYLRKLKKCAQMATVVGSHSMWPQKRFSCWRRRDCRPTWSPSVAWIVLRFFAMWCSNWRMLERYGLYFIQI